jgi:hypothetical protein
MSHPSERYAVYRVREEREHLEERREKGDCSWAGGESRR